MDRTRSREALQEFLDYLSVKGLMEKATVNTRKAAVSKIFGILDEEEAGDVVSVDIDDVVSRFTRLYGKDYTPQSLVTYKSRLRSAVEDFASYLENPLGFRSSVGPKERPKVKNKVSKMELEDNKKEHTNKLESVRPSYTAMATANILPIPIRADLIVYIQGLPFDLKEAEAKKISAVITAMVHG